MMNKLMRSRWCVSFGFIALLCMANTSYAETDKSKDAIQWSGQSIDGQKIQIPGVKQITVVIFTKLNQKSSYGVMKEIVSLSGQSKGVRLIAVASGPGASNAASQIVKKTKWNQLMVADPEYQFSGKFSVRVWPTTIMIDQKGKEIAHLAGLSSHFKKQYMAYLAYSQKEIDAKELEKRLKSNHVVSSTPRHIAARHVEVAERLLEKRQIKQAAIELQKALKLEADNADAMVLLARINILQGQTEAGLKLLARVSPDQIPAYRIHAVQGLGLVKLKKWDDALVHLEKALRLNPDPVEIYYLLGQVYESKEKWTKASRAYRLAFEYTKDAAKLGVTPTK